MAPLQRLTTSAGHRWQLSWDCQLSGSILHVASSHSCLGFLTVLGSQGGLTSKTAEMKAPRPS